MLGLVSATTAGSALERHTSDYGAAARALSSLEETIRRQGTAEAFEVHTETPTFEDGPITLTVDFPEAVLVDLLGGPVPEGWAYRDLDGDGTVEPDPAATVPARLLPVSLLAVWSEGRLTTEFVVTDR